MRELERTLKYTFGNPQAEATAKAKGKIFTSEEFIQTGSCRRHPGCRVEGWTEFYTTECLEEMVANIRRLLAPRNRRGAEASLQRGITLADCLTATQIDGATAALAKQERKARHIEYRDRRNREEQEQWAQTEAKIAQLLELALEYESHVVWVDLFCWSNLRRTPGFMYCGDEALVDIYFGGFDPPSATSSTRSPNQSSNQVHFDERVASIVEYTQSEDPRGWQFEARKMVCFLEDLADFRVFPPPHPFCEGKMRLRLRPWGFDVHLSLYTRYEALAQRVGNRYPREQQELW